MLPSIESLLHAPLPDSTPRPLPRRVIVTGLIVMAITVAYYLLMFRIEYRHPIDWIDVVREFANFAGVLAVAMWGRRDIGLLNVGFLSLLFSLWMEVVDEFTAEPLWQGTFVPAFFGIGGVILIALGVREAGRRRRMEAQRRSEAEGALRRSLVTLRAVVESTPDAVWVKDGEGRFVLANTAFADLVGRPEAALLGRAESELFADNPGDRGRIVARALESGVATRFEATVALGATPRTFLVSRNAIKSDDGQAIGTLGVARDISDRKAIEDKLLQAVHHDALTGLPNRDAFRERLARAVSRWKHQPDHPFAVLFLDIDRFKEINDRFGHAAGDELLEAFGVELGRWLRPGDFIARYGGDEFTVLLPEVANRADAEMVAGRVLAGLERPFILSAGPVQVSASIGIALSGPGADSAEALVRAADAAMYRAKAQGRSQLVTA